MQQTEKQTQHANSIQFQWHRLAQWTSKASQETSLCLPLLFGLPPNPLWPGHSCPMVVHSAGGAAQLRHVARPLKKRRKEMKKLELAADTAEKDYEKIRKQLKTQRASVKKNTATFLKAARSIVTEGRQCTKNKPKLWSCFEALMKKKVKDALSLKKENGYENPVGQVDILIKNVEPELMDEAGAAFARRGHAIQPQPKRSQQPHKGHGQHIPRDSMPSKLIANRYMMVYVFICMCVYIYI